MLTVTPRVAPIRRDSEVLPAVPGRVISSALKIGTPVATWPDDRRHRVRARTGWPVWFVYVREDSKVDLQLLFQRGVS